MDKSKNQGQPLFEQLGIDLDHVSLEHLAHYVAVKYYLEHEDAPPLDVSNEEKIQRYSEAFFHLFEVKDQKRANQLFNLLTKTLPSEYLNSLTVAFEKESKLFQNQ